MDEFNLAGEFPPVVETDWRALADKALAGAAFDTLRTSLYEGFKTEPLYTLGSSRQSNAAITAHRGWEIIQTFPAGADLSAVLQPGDEASAVWLAFDQEILPGHLHLTAAGLKTQFGALARGPRSYYLRGATIAPAALFGAYVLQEAEGAVERVGGSAGFDPLTEVAISGEIPADRSALLADAVDAAFYLKTRLSGFTPFLASDWAWHGAGGAVTHELGFTLAAAVTYWKALAGAGMPMEESSRAIGFSLTASADIFLTIAKLRAMRLLWRKANEAAGAKPNDGLKIIAEMSSRMLSECDSHVNLLRGAAAAFGASIGGATAILIHPFDSVYAGPGALSRRLARNTSLILQHEGRLADVADAAAGSHYVESLTNALAERSWALFREVEAQGGLAAALESGFVRKEIEAVRKERDWAVARKKDRITGVSAFPNLSERARVAAFPRLSAAAADFPGLSENIRLPSPGRGERFEALVSAAAGGASLTELQSRLHIVRDIIGEPLTIGERSAAPFEDLRRQSDLASENLGSRPPIFLAPLGEPEDYRESLAWAQSFFAAGGIESIVPERGFKDNEKLAATFRENPSPVVCLCSAGAAYAQMRGAASALKEAGAVFLYIAASPATVESLDPDDARACDRVIYEGCDALALLREAHRVLRVSELADRSGGDDI